MSEHTPAPWQVDPLHPIDVQTANGAREVCTPHCEDHRGFMCDPVTVVASYDEALANARLIAAAPELLAALDDIVQHIHMDSGLQRRAQDAINAARGAK